MEGRVSSPKYVEMGTTFKVRNKTKIRNRYNQIPHPTQDTIWENDKNTRKHYIRESQEVSPFPAGDHKAARKRQGSLLYDSYKRPPLIG